MSFEYDLALKLIAKHKNPPLADFKKGMKVTFWFQGNEHSDRAYIKTVEILAGKRRTLTGSTSWYENGTYMRKTYTDRPAVDFDFKAHRKTKTSTVIFYEDADTGEVLQYSCNQGNCFVGLDLSEFGVMFAD